MAATISLALCLDAVLIGVTSVAAGSTSELSTRICPMSTEVIMMDLQRKRMRMVMTRTPTSELFH